MESGSSVVVGVDVVDVVDVVNCVVDVGNVGVGATSTLMFD